MCIRDRQRGEDDAVETVDLGDRKKDSDTASGEREGASLAFASESTLKFDASSLSANALFTAEGKQGKLTATDAKVNIEASNLSWGRYYLFENFDTEGVTKENFVTEDGKLVVADKWSEQLKALFHQHLTEVFCLLRAALADCLT